MKQQRGIRRRNPVTKKLSFSYRLKKSLKNDRQLYLLALPAVVYVFIFSYIPMYGLQIAFKDFTPSKGFAGSEWIGFDHFIRFFRSSQFWPTLSNTIILSVYSLLVGFAPPIILALLLYQVDNRRFKKIVQTVTYAPHFISVVVMVSMLNLMLAPSSGVINTMIRACGGNTVNFMGEANLFRHVYVLSDIWQGIGWSSIIYLSALSGISPELYEAARVDGANRLQRILHVDIPGILPTAITMLILACGGIMNMSMQKVLLMQNPLNLETSEIISTYVYKSGLLNQQYGYSAAVGLFQSLVNLIMLVTVNSISRRVSDSSLW